jgi:F-type H+-transporting ATPase subunit gamma
MANQKQIKKRVSSIKNIGKITSALEMVSASKIQKAQSAALRAKPYADKVYELVQAISSVKTEASIPLLRQPAETKKDLYILISSNKGLTGSLNTNLLGNLKKHLKSIDVPHGFITLGNKGRTLALRNGELVADFSQEPTFYKSIPAVVEIIMDQFVKAEVDRVYLVYSDFQTVIKQEPVIKVLLPITKPEGTEKPSKFAFEPSPEEVFENLLVFYIENQLRDAIVESEASEHAARMLAMKNASDNAKDLSESLSLEYNKARQSAITTEISDVVTSKISLEE